MKRKEYADPVTGELSPVNSKGKPHDAKGREIPDPVPLAPPVGYYREPSLVERIRAIVRSEQLASVARSAGIETFEEADDFDVGDDYDPSSPYEADFEPVPVKELKRRQAEEEAKAAPPAPAPEPKEDEGAGD